MSLPCVVAVASGSPAARAGLQEGDEIVSVNGEVPRDLIEWRMLVDEPDLAVDARRGGLEIQVEVGKRPGEPLGVEVQSAVFDRVRTCDNHCEFCFIYQLPPGLRRSLYLKDDDYRLSFLYGNFTTLTRFTEADLERIVTEGLSPLYVSIHATDPDVRSEMLRNRRGATSLRWLRALLDHGVEVHGQVVLCPGVNDGPVLEDTLVGVLDRYPELASLCAVPLGVSRYNTEARMRPHGRDEAVAVLETVHGWQEVFRSVLGRRLVFAADEYYLLAGWPFPGAEEYEGFPMHEDGVGMARAFEAGLLGDAASPDAEEYQDPDLAAPHVERTGTGGRPGADPVAPNRDRGGFFRWADGGDGGAAGEEAALSRRAGEPGCAGLVAPSGRPDQKRDHSTGMSPCAITQHGPSRTPDTRDAHEGSDGGGQPVQVGGHGRFPQNRDGGWMGPGAPSRRSGQARDLVADVAPYVLPEYEPYRAPRTSVGHPGSDGSAGHHGVSEVPVPGHGGNGGSGCGGVNTDERVHVRPSKRAPVAVLTAPYGARVLQPLLARIGRPDVRLVVVDNQFFGGNIAVTGLMVGEDLSRVLAEEPAGHRYLLPDVCLTQGRFLDGSGPADLPHPVEVVSADGTGLRQALGIG